MPVPVISVAQMREWEQATWATGQSEEAVMRRAGQAVARCAERLTTAGDPVLVVAGRGHNGDDAVFAAEYLADRKATVIRVSEPDAALPEISAQLETTPALVVDGLFGIGLNRPLSPEWLRLIETINAAGLPVLAVDGPSGLNAETGEPLPDAIRAHTTLTLGAVKHGLLKSTAWPFVGRLEVAAEIGLTPCPFHTSPVYVQPGDFRSLPPRRSVSGHKGSFGHLAIVAGSRGYHGAAVLVARGAQRAQPGLVTLCVREEIYFPVAAQLQAVMVRPYRAEPVLPDNCTAIVVGPGLAASDLPESLTNWVEHLWRESPLAVIVDASALGWLPPGATTAKALRVMTPHPGEAARLLQISTADVQRQRFGAVHRLSERFGGCHVVLKGHQTVIGSSRSELRVNCSGNPHLGQGGSGDLLAGYIGGLLAQPAHQSDPLQALSFAVWQHGAAADRLQAAHPGWVVEDLALALGTATPSGFA
jgi:NAD(P)H-hydrate epimerase